AYQKRAKEEGLERAISDYIAGMTDRFAQAEFQRLYEPFERV
ncbi:MAG: deoxyguanosinetriphosphate triphosphohydrolase, partial [Planctomycetota bacterium]|nr:deoxyguanosinetriphosphate triphosphohydrolase [Planctomycetota bacterium]